VGDRRTRAGDGHRSASDFFVGDDLGLVRFDPVGRRGSTGVVVAFGVPIVFTSGIFDGVVVVVLVVAGDRVFELPDPFARLLPSSGSRLGPNTISAMMRTTMISRADISEHLVMVTRVAAPDQTVALHHRVGDEFEQPRPSPSNPTLPAFASSATRSSAVP